MILCLNKVKIYRLSYVLNWKKMQFCFSFLSEKKNIEQKTFVKIICSFFISHPILEVAIFLWPYMTRVSKKIATSKIEWLIKKLQIILTNLFLTNKPQKDPPNGQKYKKNQISQLWELIKTLGFHKALKPICSPCSEYSPHLWYPKNSLETPQNPVKSPRNPQNLKKSNFSVLGLGRDLRFSRVLQSHKSPHSEYYPHLCLPKKSPSHHICWFCINFMWNDNLTLIVLLVICMCVHF